MGVGGDPAKAARAEADEYGATPLRLVGEGKPGFWHDSCKVDFQMGVVYKGLRVGRFQRQGGMHRCTLDG
jgi:hypothetical protein